MMGMQRTLFIVVGLIAVLAIGGVFLLGKKAPAAPPAPTEIENPDPLLKAHIVFGEPDAPHVVVEFSNYLCPHCKNHALNVLPILFRDYVETGKTRYVFRALPFSGQPQVFTASVAAACVYDQARDRFLPFHELLFRANQEWGELGGEALTEKLLDYARQLSLDTEKLAACMKDETVAARVRFDQKLAAALGVDGTPTFFVDGEKKVGVQPLATWEKLLQ